MTRTRASAAIPALVGLLLAPLLSAQEAGQDGSVWNLGRVASGKSYPTSVSATNQCRGKHDFEVEVSGAVADFLRIEEPVIRQVKKGETKTAQATFDLVGVAAGDYEGLLRTECLTCKGCSEDHPKIRIKITVVEPE